MAPSRRPSGRRLRSSPVAYSPSWRPALRLSRREHALPALVHPVFTPRTVRPPLMRTVLRDTTSRYSPTGRPRPDLPHRAVARASSWTTYLSAIASVPFGERANNYQTLARPMVCARRAIRREVLFALRQGNGAGSRGVPKSKVNCL